MGTVELIHENAQAESHVQYALWAAGAVGIIAGLGMPVMVYRGTSLKNVAILGLFANAAGAGALYLALDRVSSAEELGKGSPIVDEREVAADLKHFPKGYQAVKIDLQLTNLRGLRQIDGDKIDYSGAQIGLIAAIGVASLFLWGVAGIGRWVQGWQKWQSLTALAPFSAASFGISLLYGTFLSEQDNLFDRSKLRNAFVPTLLAELDQLSGDGRLSDEDRGWIDGRLLNFPKLTDHQFERLIAQLRDGCHSQRVVIDDSRPLDPDKVAQVLSQTQWDRKELLTLTFYQSGTLKERLDHPTFSQFEVQNKVRLRSLGVVATLNAPSGR